MRSFNVPADFKTGTIDKLAGLNRKYPEARVLHTYGNMTKGPAVTASGRSVGTLPEVDLDVLSRYLKHSADNGIGFNYTLNPPHLGNREFSREGAASIKRLLHEIHEAGVRHVIVTMPSLIEIVKSTRLDFGIMASVLCQVSTPNRALEIKRLGADRIVPDESVVRDFKLLKRIREAFGGGMELIVNPCCHKECMYRWPHYNQMAECSGAAAGSDDAYYHNRCLARVFEDPANILRSMWIRPEDLGCYEAIGIECFKVQGRHLLSLDVGKKPRRGDLTRTVECYIRGSYDGDLNDLIYAFNPFYNALRVPLDNAKLEGFLKPFAEGKKVCRRDCAGCGYCGDFAKRVVDADDFKRARELAREFFNSNDEFKRMIWDDEGGPPDGFPL